MNNTNPIPELQYLDSIKHLWMTKKELDSFPKGQPIDIILFDRNWEENGFWDLPSGPYSPSTAFHKSTYTPVSNTHGLLVYHGESYDDEPFELEFMKDGEYNWGPISYMQETHNLSPHDNSFVGFRGPFVLYSHLQQLPDIIRGFDDDDENDENDENVDNDENPINATNDVIESDDE